MPSLSTGNGYWGIVILMGLHFASALAAALDHRTAATVLWGVSTGILVLVLLVLTLLRRTALQTHQMLATIIANTRQTIGQREVGVPYPGDEDRAGLNYDSLLDDEEEEESGNYDDDEEEED